VPIVPLAVKASAFWQLGSWDAFMIPKPFARITLAYGDPLSVEAPSSREAAEQTGLLAEAMAATHRLTAS
jgi:lysophospholipid acyltransferase (LPLAT)-like uncharacterized protein